MNTKDKAANKVRKKTVKRTVAARASNGAFVRKERLEARISSNQKSLINKAAKLQGCSLSDFVVTTLDKEARRIVHDFEALHFSLSEKEAFIAALESPPLPNNSLIEAFERLTRITSND